MERCRLLCCSDLHGNPPPKLDETGACAWLVAGDVVDAFSPDSGDNARAWARSRRLPIHAVRGNHDYRDPGGFFDGGRDVGGRVVELSPGVGLAGLGWCGKGRFALPDEEDLEREARLLIATWRAARTFDSLVLLTHYPARLPQLPASSNAYDSVRRLIEKLAPALVVQGHLHEWTGLTVRTPLPGGGEALVVHPGPTGCIVTLGERGWEREGG